MKMVCFCEKVHFRFIYNIPHRHAAVPVLESAAIN